MQVKGLRGSPFLCLLLSAWTLNAQLAAKKRSFPGAQKISQSVLLQLTDSAVTIVATFKARFKLWVKKGLYKAIYSILFIEIR